MESIANYTVEVEDSGAWAYGCSDCAFGLVSAPEMLGIDSFYLERIGQFLLGQLVFCDCKAGKKYAKHLEILAGRTPQAEKLRVCDVLSKAAAMPTMHYDAPAERMEQMYQFDHSTEGRRLAKAEAEAKAKAEKQEEKLEAIHERGS